MKKPTTAAARGHWPELRPITRSGKTVPVTINLDQGIYDWLSQFVGDYSFFCNVEEAITTAIRSMAGQDIKHGLDIYSLGQHVASAKGIDPSRSFFSGNMSDDRRQIVSFLLWAAAVAADCPIMPRSELPDDPAEAAMLTGIFQAVGIEIVDAIAEDEIPVFVDDEDEQPDDKAGKKDKSHTAGDYSLDDDIPF